MWVTDALSVKIDYKEPVTLTSRARAPSLIRQSPSLARFAFHNKPAYAPSS